jgi:hypothetical protein
MAANSRRWSDRRTEEEARRSLAEIEDRVR